MLPRIHEYVQKTPHENGCLSSHHLVVINILSLSHSGALRRYEIGHILEPCLCVCCSHPIPDRVIRGLYTRHDHVQQLSGLV